MMSAPPGTQLAAVTGSTIGGVYGTGPYIHLFSNNDMIYNYVSSLTPPRYHLHPSRVHN